MASIKKRIRKLVDKTLFVDTHEHLWEEAARIEAARNEVGAPFPALDFGMLFSHYTDSDLLVAGMPSDFLQQVLRPGLSPLEKWDIVAPYYERTKHTGYMRMARESARILYGVEDINRDSVVRISDRLRAQVQPGFYQRIIRDLSGIEYCQVNSLDPIDARPPGIAFRETRQPELLAQDISTVPLCTGLQIAVVAQRANREVGTLADWHGVIDWYFAHFGPRAIATKNQCAYGRGLDFERVSAEEAAPLFARFLQAPEALTVAEHKALQDHLFHYCIEQATAYQLPVKLHLGYYAGHNTMPMHRLRKNVGDVCDLLRAHPNARFDFFHIAYPYQEELLAVVKQYQNAYVDMCWAWIINPLASVAFLKELLVTASSHKVLTFGGDVMPIELLPGHAKVARQGISQALCALVEEKWLSEEDIPDLVGRLMHGNAHDLFDQQGALAAWREAS